ncbi:NYN domain-containing protein [Microbacterium enclense]|uniref:NYN domain-containing protein n=1 Tax=Microbacterium enclense TaxID=993073 RepID=UPI003F8172D6
MPATDRPTAIVYVDGFNLYRRCLERYPEARWLDLPALMDELLPQHTVRHVHYFTALIRAGAGDDPKGPIRQQTYIRALESTGRVTTHYGAYRIDRRLMPKHPAEVGADGALVRVAVRKTEEKGSDVNLAVRMLVDAHRRQADLYCMLTNDSDQVTTVRTLQEEVGVDVGWISPMPTLRQSKALQRTEPFFVACVTPEALLSNQLPDTVAHGRQTLRRPATWRRKTEGPAEAGPSNR